MTYVGVVEYCPSENATLAYHVEAARAVIGAPLPHHGPVTGFFTGKLRDYFVVKNPMK